MTGNVPVGQATVDCGTCSVNNLDDEDERLRRAQ